MTIQIAKTRLQRRHISMTITVTNYGLHPFNGGHHAIGIKEHHFAASALTNRLTHLEIFLRQNELQRFWSIGIRL